MFLFLFHTDGEWTVATRHGHLLVCTEAELHPDSPRIAVHPATTVPTMGVHDAPWPACSCGGGQ